MLAGLGLQAAGYASQMLSSLFSDLSSATSASSTTDTSSTSTASSSTSFAPSCSTQDSTNNLTGTGKPSLSGQVLMSLMHMQDDTSQTGSTGSQGDDPLQNLFSAMDTDGDGTVSQSEIESYIQNAGGTVSQADQLYTALGGTTSTDGSAATGITKDQMASALPPPPPGGGGHHGHHHMHGSGGSGSTNGADALLQALDTNNDGSVSQDEFSNFVTSNGGTQDEATSDFAALDTTGAGSLSSADFANAWENLQNSSSSSNSMMVSVLNAFASANTAAASTTSVSA